MALSANELIEQAMRTELLADATLGGIIGTRLYPIVVVQNPPRDPNSGKVLAYGTYQRISTVRERNHEGPAGVSHPRFQFNWIGSQESDGEVDYEEALEMARAARFVLDGATGTWTAITIQDVNVVDERDLYDDELQRTGIQQDVIVWHREALS